MRKILCLAVLLPLVAIAAGKADFLRVQTVLNTGENTFDNTPGRLESFQRPSAGTDWVGRHETVGGTTYEWQFNGPNWQMLYYDPNYGIHAAWMFSADPGPNYPDRNMRYNFWDRASRQWVFNQGPNFLDWGVVCFGARTGFGMLDVNPVSGCAYVSAHAGSIYPTMVKDAAPGSGTFEECSGSPVCDGYLWPSFKMGQSQKPHVALCDNASRSLLFHSMIEPWCTWSTPSAIPSPAPDPGFPTYVTAASGVSAKVAMTWEVNTEVPEPAYYRVSRDDGISWDDPVQLPFPSTFTPGSESIPSFTISSVFPFYDSHDDLHIVAGVTPYIAGQGYILPAEIWHWTEANGWSFIHRGTCDTANLMGSVGYNAVYATRPTLAESPARNELVCVWEQFDSMNIEPATGLMRADIYAALSLDGGVHWNQAVRITDPDQTSKRFPCVAAAFDDDTVLVIYEIDQVAGFALYSQGPVTQNPVIVQRVWKGDLSGTAETPVAFPTRYDINATPNPFRTGTRISYALPKSGNVRLGVYDAAGKLVARLADGVQSAGTHYADWTPTGAQPGVYFYTLVAGNTKLTKKLTLLQ